MYNYNYAPILIIPKSSSKSILGRKESEETSISSCEKDIIQDKNILEWQKRLKVQSKYGVIKI